MPKNKLYRSFPLETDNSIKFYGNYLKNTLRNK